MFFTEHLFFSYLLYDAVILTPGLTDSWFTNPKLCWIFPIYPSNSIRFLYLFKVATSVEDVLYMIYQEYGQFNKPSLKCDSTQAQKLQQKQEHENLQMQDSNKLTVENDVETQEEAYFLTLQREDNTHISNLSKSSEKDLNNSKSQNAGQTTMMKIHHVCTAALIIGSYIDGRIKIGSLVMLIHDISELPLGIMLILNRVRGPIAWQSIAFVVTVIMWVYWRVWAFSTKAIYNVMICKLILLKIICNITY